MTPIQDLGNFQNNHLFIKREDFIPYSFGGNKARKGQRFFKEIDAGGYDSVVTYGSSHSNHCRVISNMAAERGIKCIIVGPDEVSEKTFNSQMMRIFGAEIVIVPVEKVHETINKKIEDLKNAGYKPYFIPGGGHGNIGTEAYVQCYEEIRRQKFDYIFFATGTGTTHAGLVCGKLKYGDDVQIVGISIARRNPHGRQVVLDSIREYWGDDKRADEAVVFVDDYICEGYGRACAEVVKTIEDVLMNYGIPMDSTYTGKAFWGMKKYIEKHKIEDKNILFIHTGGTPLFFDDMKKWIGKKK